MYLILQLAQALYEEEPYEIKKKVKKIFVNFSLSGQTSKLSLRRVFIQQVKSTTTQHTQKVNLCACVCACVCVCVWVCICSCMYVCIWMFGTYHSHICKKKNQFNIVSTKKTTRLCWTLFYATRCIMGTVHPRQQRVRQFEYMILRYQ